MRYVRIVALLLMCLTPSVFIAETKDIDLSAKKPEEIWAMFIETHPDFDDLMRLFRTSKENATLEPYRTWAARDALQRQLNADHLKDYLTANPPEPYALAAWNRLQPIADKDQLRGVFLYGNEPFRRSAFELLERSIERKQEWVNLMWIDKEETSSVSYYVDVIWSRFLSMNPLFEDFYGITCMQGLKNLYPRAFAEMLNYDLSDDSLKHFLWLISDPGHELAIYYPILADKALRGHPEPEVLRWIVDNGVEPYAGTAKELLGSRPEEQKKQKIRAIMSVMQSH